SRTESFPGDVSGGSTARSASGDAGSEDLPGENAFQREGAFWTIVYDGKTVRLKDSKGLADIAILLANPGREIHVAELIAASAERRTDARAFRYKRMSREQLAAEGLEVSSGPAAIAALDSRARDAYRARVGELLQELEDAERSNDPGRIARTRAELDFLAGELASAYGLGGRTRRSGTGAERARKAVTWRIRSSLRKIGREHPALGRHLERSLKTGSFCIYVLPDEPVSWGVRP
ncbi:MAG: hypothetical protein ACREQ9_01745, partial [Candidatus Binatia bacterium]